MPRVDHVVVLPPTAFSSRPSSSSTLHRQRPENRNAVAQVWLDASSCYEDGRQQKTGSVAGPGALVGGRRLRPASPGVARLQRPSSAGTLRHGGPRSRAHAVISSRPGSASVGRCAASNAVGLQTSASDAAFRSDPKGRARPQSASSCGMARGSVRRPLRALQSKATESTQARTTQGRQICWSTWVPAMQESSRDGCKCLSYPPKVWPETAGWLLSSAPPRAKQQKPPVDHEPSCEKDAKDCKVVDASTRADGLTECTRNVLSADRTLKQSSQRDMSVECSSIGRSMGLTLNENTFSVCSRDVQSIAEVNDVVLASTDQTTSVVDLADALLFEAYILEGKEAIGTFEERMAAIVSMDMKPSRARVLREQQSEVWEQQVPQRSCSSSTTGDSMLLASDDSVQLLVEAPASVPDLLGKEKEGTHVRKAPPQLNDMNSPDNRIAVCRTLAVDSPSSPQSARARDVFDSMAGRDGLMDPNRLAWALKLLGYVKPEPAWIRQILEKLGFKCASPTHRGLVYMGDLDVTKFRRFVGAYQVRFRNFTQRLFAELKPNSSNCFSKDDVSVVLRRLGVSAMPGVVSELAEEICGASSPSNGFSSEFLDELVYLIHQRGGFSGRERMRIQSAFTRSMLAADVNASDAMFLPRAGIRAAFRRLSAAPVVEAQLDIHDIAFVDEVGFFAIMRAYRELEVLLVHEAFNEQDFGRVCAIGSQDLPGIFERMGYLGANAELAQELVRASSCEDLLTFEDVVMLVRPLQKNFGFLQAEAADIVQAHEKYRAELRDELDCAEAMGAIRRIGYPITAARFLKLKEDLRIGNHAGIDVSEFFSFLSILRDAALNHIDKTLAATHGGGLLAQGIPQLLVALGHSPTTDHTAKIIKEVGGPQQRLDFAELQSILQTFRSGEEQRQARETHGFSEVETHQLAIKFRKVENQKLDKSLAQSVSKAEKFSELTQLLDRLSPEARAKCTTKRAAIHDLDSYLKLRRIIQDHLDIANLQKESAAISATGYLEESVRGFRDIFAFADDAKSGAVCLEQLTAMLSAVFGEEMSRENLGQLSDLIEQAKVEAHFAIDGLENPDENQVAQRRLLFRTHAIPSSSNAACNASEPDDTTRRRNALKPDVHTQVSQQAIDFPDFLRIMRRVEDDWLPAKRAGRVRRGFQP